MTRTSLPQAFAELEVYGDWALAIEAERNRKRNRSSVEEMDEFYSAIMPRMREIVSYLNGRDLHNLAAEEQALLNLSLSLMEISFPVEYHRLSSVPNGFPFDRYDIYQ